MGRRPRHSEEVVAAGPRERRAGSHGGGIGMGIGMGIGAESCACHRGNAASPAALRRLASGHHFRVSGGDLRPLTPPLPFQRRPPEQTCR